MKTKNKSVWVIKKADKMGIMLYWNALLGWKGTNVVLLYGLCNTILFRIYGTYCECMWWKGSLCL